MISKLFRLLFVLTFVMVQIVPALADSFEQGNQQFKSGDFAAAVAAYEKSIATDGPSAAAYYNLGNSYQRLDKPGPAILAYERASLIKPRDPDLRANLTSTRKSNAAFEESQYDPRLDVALRHFSRNEWSWLFAGSALFLAALSIVTGVMGFPRKSFYQITVASAVLACLVITSAAGALYLTRHDSNRGVILAEDAAVRLSPFETAESLGTPAPGRIVQMGRKQGNFRYIEIPSTKLRGWVSQKQVASIIP